MTLADGIVSGFLQSISFEVLPYLTIGALFGLVVGIIPGLSGHFAMAMAVTFLYTMEPATGIAFLLAAHATVAQGGGLTAILFSTPGTGQNAATLLDGPAMRDNGDAGIAVGAAMTACFVGAVFGAVVLVMLVPVLREVVLLFGPPEIFCLAVLGLVFVAVLGQRDLVRSLIAGLLGLFLAMVGLNNVTSTERFTLGIDRLADGIPLVPAILGLFAVAEMITIWNRGGSLAGRGPRTLSMHETQRQIFTGVRLAFRHWGLVLRSSAIGTTIGLIPGLGSSTAAFLAYGHARQSSRNPDAFGTGTVEGVIAPEAANDAVEGGALASTVAFGIPGSSSMAILLSGLSILGLQTGPQMLNAQVDIVFVMVFTIILGNLIGTLCGMVLLNPLVRVTMVRASRVVPILLVLIVSGSFAGDRILADITITLIFGGLGYVASLLRYSRAALLIGFVLGATVDKTLNLSLQLRGPFFYLDGPALFLTGITLVFLFYNVWKLVRRPSPTPRSSPSGKRPAEGQETPTTRADMLTLETVFIGAIGVLAFGAFWTALSYSPGAARTPLVTLVPLILLVLGQGWRLLRLNPTRQIRQRLSQIRHGKLVGLNAVLRLYSSLFGFLALIICFGHFAGVFGFTYWAMRRVGHEPLRTCLLFATSTVIAIYLLFNVAFGVEMYQGLLWRYFAGYRDF